jgi:hypothetical protein
MVSGALIQGKVNYGLGKAGTAAGFPYAWYRPTGAGPVIASGNLMSATPTLAYIVTKATLFPSPSEWSKADRFAAFDPTDFLAGDYLVAAETMFVAEIVPLAAAIRLVLCNETFTWSRLAKAPAGPGFDPSGVLTPYATGWPGWIEASDRRSPGELHLPGAVEMPSAMISLPASIPGQILRGDELTTGDTLNLTWTVQSAVLSPNGWQITAIRAGA